MTNEKMLKSILSLWFLASLAVAQTVTGTVTNGTSGKLAAGVDVVLINLGQGGMQEGARTKTDKQGKYSFDLGKSQAPAHLIRAVYQDVTYNKQLPPGQTTADIEIFDAVKSLPEVGATVQVMRLQATADQLQAVELYAIKNDATPKRTVMSDQTFAITLPAGAQIDQSMAQAPNGMPVQSAAVPDGKTPGRYYFVFPLRPGETRFQVSYHVPYKGSFDVAIKPPHALEHFVVITPKAMTFAPGDAQRFQSMNGNQGEDQGANTQVATSVKAGETISFKVSGTGDFPREQQGAEAATASAGGGADDQRPGGGLGRPIEAPDPLHEYRWYVLGTIVVGLTATAFFAMKRPAPAAAAAGTSASTTLSALPHARGADALVRQAAAGGDTHATLLNALKEELFQLEVDRQEERISADEYQRAKAALDLVIARALKRGKAKVV